MVFFERVPLAPPDPIFGLTAAYAADSRENKVNLGVGYYRDENLRTPILQCVKRAEKIFLEREPNKEYLPIEGHASLIEKIGELVFGNAIWEKEKSRIAGFQTIGGTGALKVVGTFFKEELDCPLLIPSPTWPNHRGIFTGCQLQIDSYPYYGAQSHEIAFDALCTRFETAKKGSVVLLHASCHNPSGLDLSLEKWQELYSIIQTKGLIPLFDFAYQGLGEGLEEDAKAIRFFAEKGYEMCVAFSAAKNFSLYGERLGALFIAASNAHTVERITSRVKQMIRTNYSNPPKHGASIVAHILCDAELKAEWISELHAMRTRIHHMRKELADQLHFRSGAQDFEHIKKGLGMFCVTGFDEVQVERLKQEYGIYMPSDGRINVCGLNQNNIDYSVNAILNIY